MTHPQKDRRRTDLNALADRLGIDRDKAATLLYVVKSTHPLFLRLGDEWCEVTMKDTTHRPVTR